MASKLLFYCSWGAVRGDLAWPVTIVPWPSTMSGRGELFSRGRQSYYPGLSRCTTFTGYPAVRSSLPTSSAIITERCCPPVQPKEMVR
jgi:hypothetical protein